jgi:hypothetical protein
MIPSGWLLIDSRSLLTSFLFIPITWPRDMQSCTLSAFYVYMGCPTPSSLTEELNSLLVSRSSCMLLRVPIWSTVRLITHRQMVRQSVWTKCSNICSVHMWWTTGTVRTSVCHWLSSLTITVIRIVSRWHLLKFSTTADVVHLWTRLNLARGWPLAQILSWRLRKSFIVFNPIWRLPSPTKNNMPTRGVVT